MFKPLYDRILVKRVDAEEKTPGGLYIPDTAQEKPMEGVVIAVGDGAIEDGVRIAPSVSIDDTVIFGKWAGTEIKIKNEDYLILEEKDILGILGE